MSRRIRLAAVVVLATLLSAAFAHSAYAFGYYNLPGNCCQWFGYGCGPGYHACMVLGPVQYQGSFRHNVERLPYAPCSSYGGCGNGYGHPNGFDVSEPTLLEPATEPIPAPGPAMEPEPTPAAYRVPFRY